MAAERCSDFEHSDSPDYELQRRDRLDERLSCAVCLGRFDDPRMLDCRHSFCRKCLDDVVHKRPLDPEHPIGMYIESVQPKV